jgi:hypothetical protein
MFSNALVAKWPYAIPFEERHNPFMNRWLRGLLSGSVALVLIASCTDKPRAARTHESPPAPTPTASPIGRPSGYRWAGLFAQTTTQTKNGARVLWRYDLTTGSLTRAAWNASVFADYLVSPDGKRVLTLSTDDFTRSPSRLSVANANDLRHPRKLVSEEQRILDATWAADGKTILYLLELQTRKTEGEEVPIAVKSVSATGEESPRELARFLGGSSFSLQGTNRSGTKLYWFETVEGGYNGRPTEMDLRTGARRDLAPEMGFVRASPVFDIEDEHFFWADESTLMMRSFSGQQRTVYSLGPKVRAKNGMIAFLTLDAIHDRIALMIDYPGMEEGHTTTYVIPAVGGKPKLITDERREDWAGPGSWLPDGSALLMHMYCSCGDKPEKRIYLIDPTTGSRVDLLPRLTTWGLQGWAKI